MDEILNNWYSGTSAPVLSAFILGLMTAISPCPLATNITAIGFISKDLENRKRIFRNGLIYTLGRVFGYTGLAVIIYFGASKADLSGWFQRYGEKIIGPLLILIGVLMLGILKIKFPALNKLTNRIGERSNLRFLDVFLLGVLFALAFCPYSGVLYFGLLIPLTLKTASGLYLPVVFAIATAIPVIIFAWLVAFMVSGVGKLYNKLQKFDFWFRRVVAIMFIAVGIYYCYFTILSLF